MSQRKEWLAFRPVLLEKLAEVLPTVYVDPERAKELFLRAIDEPVLEKRLMTLREIEKLPTLR